jgi:hypothetical protein
MTDIRIHECVLLNCGPNVLQQLTAEHHALCMAGSVPSGQSLSVKSAAPITADSAMIGPTCRQCYNAHSRRSFCMETALDGGK